MTSTGLEQRAGKRRRRVVAPETRLGRWAVGSTVAGFILLNFAWKLMGPFGGFPGLVLGVIGGALALVAIFRRGERSLAVYASLVPFASIVAFVLADVFIGHD